jgi:hypothetical protein
MGAVSRVNLLPPRLLKLPFRSATLGESSSELRRKFWENEAKWSAGVDLTVLCPLEKKVHFAHEEAVSKGHFTYKDPITEYRVMTRLRHFVRGKCCGNACRHVSNSNRKSGRKIVLVAVGLDVT